MAYLLKTDDSFDWMVWLVSGSVSVSARDGYLFVRGVQRVIYWIHEFNPIWHDRFDEPLSNTFLDSHIFPWYPGLRYWRSNSGIVCLAPA
jgi:hypothetical protein